MRLIQLLNHLRDIPCELDREIDSLTLDSRQVTSNSLFCAVAGSQSNGSDYVEEALKRGAAAILYDAELNISKDMITKSHIPLIALPALKNYLGEIADRFYQHPSRQLKVIGVTGTSGKTSCTNLIAQACDHLNISCGLIGTLGSGYYGELKETGLTTPDAITLQSLLASFVKNQAKAVAMEVSSHSIDQGRINATQFELSIFTNLSQDHLDYHGDMQTYASVKRRFFTDFPSKLIILNVDDAYGLDWAHALADQKRLIAYATKEINLPAEIPLIYAENMELTLDGIKAQVNTPWGSDEIHLSLIGAFNLSNALAVLATLCLQGVDFSQALEALQQVKPVPGRMQMFRGTYKPLVVVDYAHKPDALNKALSILRQHTKGKLICVFGCGGERDRLKRPMMAAIAEQHADKVIVTNDNPRHEKDTDIIEDIMKGFKSPDQAYVELDRAQAIAQSIDWAAPEDCILIAGKGTESYQQIGSIKHPFDDAAFAQKYLAKDC